MNEDSVILYVEDEDSIREEMLEILELDYKNIYIASNGQEGVDMYKKHTPDVVISDVQMPIMDGIEMSKKIISINPEAKIILMTAFNEDKFILDAKEIGIKDYVYKPLDVEKLLGSINRCIK